MKTKEIFKQEIRKWEKAFEKKMKVNERRMFIWGLVYGVGRGLEEVMKNNHSQDGFIRKDKAIKSQGFFIKSSS